MGPFESWRRGSRFEETTDLDYEDLLRWFTPPDAIEVFWKADHDYPRTAVHQMRGADKEGKLWTLCNHHIGRRDGFYTSGPSDCQNCQSAKAKDRKVWDAIWAALRKEYAEYRKTFAWRDRCAWVMHRSGGYCEACLVEPATEVHHKTYAHLFNEPLFDLVAICRPCHENVSRIDRERRAGKVARFTGEAIEIGVRA